MPVYMVFCMFINKIDIYAGLHLFVSKYKLEAYVGLSES